MIQYCGSDSVSNQAVILANNSSARHQIHRLFDELDNNVILILMHIIIARGCCSICRKKENVCFYCVFYFISISSLLFCTTNILHARQKLIWMYSLTSAS